MEGSPVGRDPVEVLSTIRGVVHARLEWGADGPERVEVLADADRPASQVARDVRSALAAWSGFDVGPDRVRVVRLEGFEAASLSRLEVGTVVVTRSERELVVRVGVRFGDQVGEGEARTVADLRMEPHLGVRATLAAVAQVLGGDLFALHGLAEVEIGEQRALVVALASRRRDTERVRFGVAPVVDGAADAAARATVHAMVFGTVA